MNSHSLYKIFIAPRSSDPNVQSHEVVLNWLLVGALSLTLADFINTLASLLFLHETYPTGRLIMVVGLFGFLTCLLASSRRRQQLIMPAIALVAIFVGTAAMLVYQLDIINPIGLLLFGLAIVMAGILLGARFSLYVALLTAIILSVLTYGKAHNYLTPDLDWTLKPSRFTDVVSFSAIFAVMALASWLFNRRTEMALTRAKRSEKALKRQRDLLEMKVEQRTRQLQAAQLEQVQQFYRFAELGRLSTALFHDLSSHLMSVSIDIEGLRKQQHSDSLARLQDNVQYIDKVVRRVRQQIGGKGELERFDIVGEIREAIAMLAYFSGQKQVSIDLQVPPGQPPIMYRGDLTRFRQVIINLLSNAIEAYQTDSRPRARQHSVAITAAKAQRHLSIAVTDHGKGIRPAARVRIFEPFYSTKQKGTGIGLFVVRKVVEEDFRGTINVTSSKRAGTTFTVTMPLFRARRPALG